MKKIETKYGTIESSGITDYDRAGNIRSVIASSKCVLKTRFGNIVPNYSSGEPRKKYRSSVSFYEDGTLESVYLEEPAMFQTSIGEIEAELVTFYKGEYIKRIFPRYGQISGYWSEEDEYNLYPEIEIEITGKKQKCKALCISFYDTGALESITVWRQTPLIARTILGDIKTDFGLQLYKDGTLKSIEPLFGAKFNTFFGEIFPSNPEHDPFHAEDNSLLFWPNGDLRLVRTVKNNVEIIRENGKIEIIKPDEKEDWFDENVMVKEVLEIEFLPYKILIRRENGNTYAANITAGDKCMIK